MTDVAHRGSVRVHTIEQVMERADRGRSTIRKLVQDGTLEAVRFPGDPRVYITDESCKRLFIPIPANPRRPTAQPKIERRAEASKPPLVKRRSQRRKNPSQFGAQA
jgi:hypothetical protein